MGVAGLAGPPPARLSGPFVQTLVQRATKSFAQTSVHTSAQTRAQTLASPKVTPEQPRIRGLFRRTRKM